MDNNYIELKEKISITKLILSFLIIAALLYVTYYMVILIKDKFLVFADIIVVYFALMLIIRIMNNLLFPLRIKLNDKSYYDSNIKISIPWTDICHIKYEILPSRNINFLYLIPLFIVSPIDCILIYNTIADINRSTNYSYRMLNLYVKSEKLLNTYKKKCNVTEKLIYKVLNHNAIRIPINQDFTQNNIKDMCVDITNFIENNNMNIKFDII
ncbi:hypothetical protein J6P92_01770 [bacterium]|nr:hypothetical protein [bacterium]